MLHHSISSIVSTSQANATNGRHQLISNQIWWIKRSCMLWSDLLFSQAILTHPPISGSHQETVQTWPTQNILWVILAVLKYFRCFCTTKHLEFYKCKNFIFFIFRLNCHVIHLRVNRNDGTGPLWGTHNYNDYDLNFAIVNVPLLF